MKAHRRAKHPSRTVRTNKGHFSFPRVSVGRQAYEHFHRYVEPRASDSVRSARGIRPQDTSKPHGKRASTTSPTPVPSPLRHVVSTVLSQALPWAPAQGKFMQGWVWSPRPLAEDLQRQSYEGQKNPPKQIIVHQHCSFAAVILKRRNSSELLYTWLQPLNQTYSHTFSFIILLSFFQVLQKPGLQCLATQKPKEASTKPANTSHLLTNVI